MPLSNKKSTLPRELDDATHALKKNGKNPLVSVVIPAYNEQRYLKRCIDSLLQQTYVPLEILFIDDGSKDATRKILKLAEKKNKQIRVFFRDHGGPGAARNFGAKKAKGKILVFVDADMMFDPTYISTLTAPIISGKTHGTTHTRELVANIDNPWARAWCLNRIPEPAPQTGVYRAVLRDVFLRSGGFDPKKGYFDDDLGKLGPSTHTQATCYHNNPETLSEVFKHSMWVGRSFAQRTDALWFYVIRYVAFLLIGVMLLGVATVLVIRGAPLWIVLLCALLLLWLGLVAQFALRRIVYERYAPYLWTIPTLWIFRLTGYFFGFVQGIIRRRKH